MKETKKKGIKHLTGKNSISDSDLISILNFLKPYEHLSSMNSHASEKVDGFGFRFGMSDNRFFVESSRSGPIYKSGIFSKYNLEKYGTTTKFSDAYEELFLRLSNWPELIQALKFYDKDVKVVCECLFYGLGEVIDDRMKFVTIEYDEHKLGKFATFIPLKLLDSDGNEIPSSTLFYNLTQLNNGDIKFVDTNLKYYVDISDELKLFESNDHLINIREKLNDKLKTISSDILGQYYEGIVFNVNGIIFKAINDRFTQNHFVNIKVDNK